MSWLHLHQPVRLQRCNSLSLPHGSSFSAWCGLEIGTLNLGVHLCSISRHGRLRGRTRGEEGGVEVEVHTCPSRAELSGGCHGGRLPFGLMLAGRGAAREHAGRCHPGALWRRVARGSARGWQPPGRAGHGPGPARAATGQAPDAAPVVHDSMAQPQPAWSGAARAGGGWRQSAEL